MIVLILIGMMCGCLDLGCCCVVYVYISVDFVFSMFACLLFVCIVCWLCVDL